MRALCWQWIAHALGCAREGSSSAVTYEGVVCERLEQSQRLLIILDDVPHSLAIDTICPSLLQSPHCSLLITAQHTPATGADSLTITQPVEPLSVAAAATLLAFVMQQEDTNRPSSTEFAVAHALAEQVGRLPQAIKLTGAYACHQPRTLDQIALELARPAQQDHGETLSGGAHGQGTLDLTTQLDGCFERSWGALRADAQTLLMALALHESSAFPQQAALELQRELGWSGAPKRKAGRPSRHSAESPLQALLRFRLLDLIAHEPRVVNDDTTTTHQSRLGLHSSVRAFARNKLREASDTLRDGTQATLAQFYAAYIERFQAGVFQLGDDLFGPDESNLINALTWAHEQHEHALVARLCVSMSAYWRLHFHHERVADYLAWGMEALEALIMAAREADGPADAEADIRHWSLQRVRLEHTLGWIYQQRGRISDAKRLFEANLEQRRALADLLGAVSTLISLGEIAYYASEYDVALQCCVDSHMLLDAYPSADTEGNLLQLEGKIHLDLGEYEAANNCWTRAEACYKQSENIWGIATTCILRGVIALERNGDIPAALRWYRYAYDLDSQTAGRYYAQFFLARVFVKANRLQRAAALFAEVREWYKAVGDSATEAEVCLRQGELAERRRNQPAARECYTTARELAAAACVHRIALAAGTKLARIERSLSQMR